MSPLEKEQPLILVVDHQPEVLAELATVLSGAGYRCRLCTTAEDAVAATEDEVPDLIIAEVHLGATSGLELCERIKLRPALAEVPVMFLSGTQIPDIIRRSHAVGGSYYVRKPFDPAVLLELIEKAVWLPRLVGAHAS
jgi:putative two-component system response regulator